MLEVAEQAGGAVVSELAVRNDGTLPVLLVEGETILGVQQNRVVGVSMLVPPRGRVVVPVSCVEAGRWGTAERWRRSPRHAPLALRGTHTASVRASRRADMFPRSDQRAVWDRVAEYGASFASTSETDALEAVYDRARVRLGDLVDELAPEPDQCGVIVAIGGEVRSADLFDKPATLAAYWPSLVVGYGIDALGVRPRKPVTARARAFMAALSAASRTPRRALGAGRDVLLRGAGVEGTALEWGGAVVHLAAYATTGPASAQPGRTAP